MRPPLAERQGRETGRGVAGGHLLSLCPILPGHSRVLLTQVILAALYPSKGSNPTPAPSDTESPIRHSRRAEIVSGQLERVTIAEAS